MRGLSACFLLAGFAHAADVYLNSPLSFPSRLSTSRASAVIARHLQLDTFEPLQNSDEIPTEFLNEPFVGQGERSSLLISVDGAVAKDVIPEAIHPAFTLATTQPIPSFSKLVSTALERAPHIFSHIFTLPAHFEFAVPRLLDIFSVSSDATERFLSEIAALVDFLESDVPATDKFAAFELKGLSEIEETYGRASEQYTLAAESLRASIISAFAKDNLNVVVLTTDKSPVSLQKRAPQQSPLPPPATPQPIGSDAACFTTADSCNNATNACTGRGECVRTSKLGRACYVCACSATQDEKGRTDYWAGDACQRKDVSGPFVLITGTVIGLILLIGGSVSFLWAMGGEELPSTLTGPLTAGHKRE